MIFIKLVGRGVKYVMHDEFDRKLKVTYLSCFDLVLSCPVGRGQKLCSALRAARRSFLQDGTNKTCPVLVSDQYIHRSTKKTRQQSTGDSFYTFLLIL